MALFSIADLHLSLASPKPMDKFGARWTDHTAKLEKRWRAVVSDSDTVVVPGDISWAMDLDGASPDLHFIDSLPGHKLIGKGNHDFWWCTRAKLDAFIEKENITTIDFLYNSAAEVEDYIVCGTRGWYVEKHMQNAVENADYDKIVARETVRLRMSLDEAVRLRGDTDKKILVYFHFPPVFGTFVCREFIDVLKEYGIKNCYHGHIHGSYVSPRTVTFEGIEITMISADFLDFIPMITMPLDF